MNWLFDAFVTDFWLRLSAAVPRSGEAPVFGIESPFFWKEKADIVLRAVEKTKAANKHS